MSNLNAFIQEIEERKQKEISLLDSAMTDKKTNIQKTKENTIKALQEQYKKEAKTQSQKEAAKIIEAARLKAKEILFDAINKNTDSTFDTIKQELKLYSQESGYKTTINSMLDYVKKKLGSDVIIHCNDKDHITFKDMNVNLGSPINTTGGILAEDKTGKREIDLTFEELLRTREDDVKSFLLEKMIK